MTLSKSIIELESLIDQAYETAVQAKYIADQLPRLTEYDWRVLDSGDIDALARRLDAVAIQLAAAVDPSLKRKFAEIRSKGQERSGESP